MKEYYDLIDNIYNTLIADNSINTVTSGDILDVDLSKQSIFPLAHIIVSDVSFGDGVIQFTINVIAMDVGSIRQGSLNDNGYEISGTPTASQFEDRFENLLTGWSLSLNIEIGNQNVTFGGTSCD